MTHPLDKELDDLKQIINTTKDSKEYEHAWLKFQLVRFQRTGQRPI